MQLWISIVEAKVSMEDSDARSLGSAPGDLGPSYADAEHVKPRSRIYTYHKGLRVLASEP